MFNPPQLKYKKLHKGTFRNKELNKNAATLKFGDFGIKLAHKGLLTFDQIESARRIIAKNIKGIGKLWIRSLPDNPRTSKPAEMRMGKGKGNVNTWVWNVKAGAILFEVSSLRVSSNLDFLKIAKRKLPIKSFIVYR